MRAKTSAFVAEFPLCTIAADEAALPIRLDAQRNVYNASLGASLRRLDLMREAWTGSVLALCLQCLARTPRASRYQTRSGRTCSKLSSLGSGSRPLAAERKRAHGELANPILEQRSTIKTEQLSYTSFPKNSVAA
jgi:hypothetical protein